MAYADERGTRFSPASVSAAVIVNGAFLAMLMLGVPDVTKIIPGEPIHIIDIFRPPVATPPETRKRSEPDKKTATVPQTVTTKTPPQVSNSDLSAKTGFTVPAFPAEEFGTISEPPALPPVHNPVEIGARLNPRYAADLQPSYPPGLLRREIEGAVTVRVLVGTDGRVKDVHPVRVSEEDFLKVTREQALKKWRFTPATRDGIPVDSWREMTVRFEMPS